MAAGSLSPGERRAVLESELRRTGLAYGTGAADRAVELPPGAGPGMRAFAQLVAGLARLCSQAGALCGAPLFLPQPDGQEPVPHHARTQARRSQLLAVLAAVGGDADAAARLFADPLGPHDGLTQRLASRVALRLSKRYLADGGPFEGLPLHTGLCAIEVRVCATLALASFQHGRISPAAARVNSDAALSWRLSLVEMLSSLSQAQERGQHIRRSMEQVLRTQRLPAREARALRAVLKDPRPPEELDVAFRGDALRRFALEQVLLAAHVDGKYDAGEVAFVERLAAAMGLDWEEVASVEAAVNDFYSRNQDALAALRRAETSEGLPHAITTRLQEIVTDNLDRIMMEIRKTGELAELLAKASVGTTLTDVEKKKVRDQLIDLAKTIPALAIFAAPGGMLLLPILLKLMPFNLLPSSFADPPRRPMASKGELQKIGS